MTDAKPADTGGGAETGAPAGGVASALHNQVFKVACPNQSGMAASCTVGANGANDPLRSFTKEFAIGGDPNKVYKVTLKFCGLFEGRSLTGCAATGSTPNVCVDGMTVNSPSYLPTYPTLILDVPEPKHIYHLNRKLPEQPRSRSTTTSTPSTSRVAPRSRSSLTAATTAASTRPTRAAP